MQDLIRYVERSFSKGYRDDVKPELLTTGYAADALNCEVDDDKILKRHGYTMVGGDIGSSPGLGLATLEKADGTKRIVAVWNNSQGTYSVYAHWTGSGLFTAIPGGMAQTLNKETNFEQAADKLYSFNATDTSLAYDGTNATPVPGTPIGKYAKWFNNFMFVAGNSTYPNRIYFSDAGDPETWGGSDYIDVNPDDGDTITGLNALGNELLITKRNKVYALTGFDVGTFSIKDINERINGFGNISHGSLQNIGNDTLFLSFVGVTPHIRSIQRTTYAVNVAGGIISQPIEGTMSKLNYTKLNLATSVFDGKKYYLAVPNGSATKNDLVIIYDTVSKCYVRWTGINAAHWVTSTIGGKAEIYFQESGSDSKVYKLDNSNSDNGAGIDFQYKTRMYSARGVMNDLKPDTKAKWKYLYITGDSGSNVDLTIQKSPNSFEFDTIGTMNLKGTSSALPFDLPEPLGIPSVVWERVNIAGSPHRLVQFLFSQNEANKPVTIREYSLLFKPKKLRDA